MQNYIEKKRSPYFILFCFEKQIKIHVSPFTTFISTKRSQNRIRHNLLSESEQVSLDLRVFLFVLFANFDHKSLVNHFTCFLFVFSLFFNGHGLTWLDLLCLLVGVSPPNIGG